MMTYEEPLVRKSTVFGFAVFFLVVGWVIPLTCLKGCEAGLEVMMSSPKLAVERVSPDGKWRLLATRDPGFDGDAAYDLWMANGDGTGRQRIGTVGDHREYHLEVTWSADSSLAAVWVEGELAFVHDVSRRPLLPRGQVVPPPSRWRLTREEVDSMVARKYPMEVRAGLLESIDAGTWPIAKPKGLESNRRP